ncbi:MAG TPA: amidohydrolase family protein [Longimicrobiales bacterium]|nr:amidohydrolase family protein [Longimicrobiales bacterium]
MRRTPLVLAFALLLPGAAVAQQTTRTQPIEGLRDNPVRFHALTGARVVTGPGASLEQATIVIRDGVIQAVGPDVPVPAGARVWDLTGTTIYPGFIDAHADLGMDDPPEEGDVGPTHWNRQVRAWFSTSRELEDDADRRQALRSMGFGAALAVPRLGIFRGQAAVVDLGDGNVRGRVVRPDLVHAVDFDRSTQLGWSYPNSPMGAIALMRQTFLDADWYQRAWDAYGSGGDGFLSPERSEALEALELAAEGRQPVLFEVDEEVEFLRVQALTEEFGLSPWVRGSGDEYKILDVVAGAEIPLIIPIDFPDAPDVQDPQDALNADLADLRHWYLAPTNPARLADAGVRFAITTDGLASESDFLPNLRTAVARGLSRADALAALTTTPAALLGIRATHGTIERGKVANLVIMDGDLFDDGTGVRDVWVEGERYTVAIPPRVDPRGEWRIATTGDERMDATLDLGGTLNRLRGTIAIGGQEIELESVSARTEAGRVTLTFPGEPLGMEGTVQLSASIDQDTFYGWGTFPDGMTTNWRGERVGAFTGRATAAGPARDVPDLDLPEIFPAMAYGVESVPAQPEWVVVRNATVWTQGPQGRLENADLLVRAGRVAEVGRDLRAPSGAVEIDATGKHVTPGLIDPHIHSGTDGVNESGFAIVPEVRMGDVVTHDNIWLYRQLAGGLTTAHVKHGSANPIGGQNVFVKTRWGALPTEIVMDAPPRTVKFALGENPKRRSGRYPDTRMGTYQIIRDHFQAARDYQARWDEWERTGDGLPPRRDLRMEALVDILDQELLVSSHGYRQDEFLALIRLAEEFGFRIQTLQHGVEAYKIAPELAASGVGAAVWSDWGAFKAEAYDATTYNARILLEAGVQTSLHSDNSQIASRMNWEAGKLLRTGVSEEDALSTVTIGAAAVIDIDDRVGSLEEGKDADFVIWNGHPLSQFTKAEQTWIDGRPYFTLEQDAMLRDRVREERARLIQLVLERSGNGGN